MLDRIIHRFCLQHTHNRNYWQSIQTELRMQSLNPRVCSGSYIQYQHTPTGPRRGSNFVELQHTKFAIF